MSYAIIRRFTCDTCHMVVDVPTGEEKYVEVIARLKWVEQCVDGKDTHTCLGCQKDVSFGAKLLEPLRKVPA